MGSGTSIDNKHDKVSTNIVSFQIHLKTRTLVKFLILVEISENTVHN